jgi:peroxiredoxin
MSEAPSPRRRWLFPGLAAAVALFVIVGAWYLNAPEATLVKVGMTAPDMELVGELGGVQRLSTYRGQAVLLVFFMSDCHICQEDIPQLELVNREFRNKGLAVLGVNVDADFTAYKSFILKNSLTFGMYRDPGGPRILEAFGSYQLPEAYLIDTEGKVAAVWLGKVEWRSRSVRERILDVLPKKS